MIRVAYLKIPEDHIDELGHKYAEMPMPPEFILIKSVALKTDTSQGLQLVSQYEYADDREEDAVKFLEERYQQFHEVDGVDFRFEEWIEVQDLLDAVHDNVSATDVMGKLSLSI